MVNMVAQTWVDALQVFNDRNMSRSMDLEIISEDLGAQSEVRGLALGGVAYDRRDGNVEIMLGGKRNYHITHTIGNVTGIDMLTCDSPINDVLRIQHDGGAAILTASAPQAVEP